MSRPCPQCGHNNRDAATYCGKCGSHLSLPSISSSTRQTELDRLIQRGRSLFAELWTRAQEEARGWYAEFVTQQPALVGKIADDPEELWVTQVTTYYLFLNPANRQLAQLPGLRFAIDSGSAMQPQPVVLVGDQHGGVLQKGDRVKAWGVNDHQLQAIRAWKIEVWERSGVPTNLSVTTARPLPLALISVGLLGMTVFCCLLSLLAR